MPLTICICWIKTKFARALGLGTSPPKKGPSFILEANNKLTISGSSKESCL